MPELTRRYVVAALATEAPFDPRDPDGVFMLKPWKDPAAFSALQAYRDHCYPELARDLDAWIRVIAEGPVVRGDVGRRNEPHATRPRRGAASPAPARAARKKRRAADRRPATPHRATGKRRSRRR